MKAIKLTAALFSVLCLFSMCKKDSKSASKNDANAPNQTYYVKGTLNGQAWNWQVSPDLSAAYVVGSSSSLSNNQGDISGGITALISASAGFQPQLGIEFKTFNKGSNDNAATVFNNFVNTGSWAYASTTNYTIGTKSIVIYYTDNTGKQYSSIGAQSGSSANIITVTPVAGSAYNNDPGLKIKLTFNCKLYPLDGTGNAIAATNTEATVFLDDLL